MATRTRTRTCPPRGWKHSGYFHVPQVPISCSEKKWRLSGSIGHILTKYDSSWWSPSTSLLSPQRPLIEDTLISLFGLKFPTSDTDVQPPWLKTFVWKEPLIQHHPLGPYNLTEGLLIQSFIHSAQTLWPYVLSGSQEALRIWSSDCLLMTTHKDFRFSSRVLSGPIASSAHSPRERVAVLDSTAALQRMEMSGQIRKKAKITFPCCLEVEKKAFFGLFLLRVGSPPEF